MVVTKSLKYGKYNIQDTTHHGTDISDAGRRSDRPTVSAFPVIFHSCCQALILLLFRTTTGLGREYMTIIQGETKIALSTTWAN